MHFWISKQREVFEKNKKTGIKEHKMKRVNKPDEDNLVKCVKDALQQFRERKQVIPGIFFKNDATACGCYFPEFEQNNGDPWITMVKDEFDAQTLIGIKVMGGRSGEQLGMEV